MANPRASKARFAQSNWLTGHEAVHTFKRLVISGAVVQGVLISWIWSLTATSVGDSFIESGQCYIHIWLRRREAEIARRIMSPTLLHYKHRVENEVAVQMRAEEDYRSCRQLLQAGWAPTAVVPAVLLADRVAKAAEYKGIGV